MTLEQRTDYGGIIRDPRYWATSAGYEFQATFGNADILAGLSSTNDGLSGYGWISTSLVGTDGTAGDLLSSADIDPTRAATDGSSDTIVSPRIFGSYYHALQASRFLGYFPVHLCVEFYASFSTHSANETTTYIGFAAPGNVDAGAAGCAGAVTTDGTNWKLVSDNATDGGIADGGTWITFKIVVDATNTNWFIDGAHQGSITTEADIWPQSFKMFTGTTNRPNLAWVRIWYE